jgi:hypothetical protein
MEGGFPPRNLRRGGLDSCPSILFLIPRRLNTDVSKQRMEFYYMINYYFKYLELLDTVFLAFKKKPLRESF